jgi:hypothetical protein
LVLLTAAPLRAAADHPSAATRADLRQLQAEADLLDDTMRLVDDDHPRAREFRRREQDIREDLVRLRAQVRRHEADPNRGLSASKAEVNAIRNDIADLRVDIEASTQTGLTASSRARGDVSLAEGTEIQVRLDQSLSSKTSRQEDRITATITQSIRADDGSIAIPAGASVSGTVHEVEPARRPARGGRMGLSFDSINLSGGERVDVTTRVVSLEQESIDRSKAGLGALVGGVLGAVFEGTKGAIVGALLGGTGAVIASRGDDVELPTGTLLTLRLERPVSILR